MRGQSARYGSSWEGFVIAQVRLQSPLPAQRFVQRQSCYGDRPRPREGIPARGGRAQGITGPTDEPRFARAAERIGSAERWVIEHLVDSVVGTDGDLRPYVSQFLGRRNHEARHLGPVARADGDHVLPQRIGMHRYPRLRMSQFTLVCREASPP